MATKSENLRIEVSCDDFDDKAVFPVDADGSATISGNAGVRLRGTITEEGKRDIKVASANMNVPISVKVTRAQLEALAGEVGLKLPKPKAKKK